MAEYGTTGFSSLCSFDLPISKMTKMLNGILLKLSNWLLYRSVHELLLHHNTEKMLTYCFLKFVIFAAGQGVSLYLI